MTFRVSGSRQACASLRLQLPPGPSAGASSFQDRCLLACWSPTRVAQEPFTLYDDDIALFPLWGESSAQAWVEQAC